ncbi:hypothetical protein K227x_10010 [Rubripirellula lacrimiformis]|uniref:Potassium channel protein n=1 Tax=Rubripirellula lacrimiformis TaxID=1930273 RepID=A0A517N665_9BACT|nr:potassium channel protein [Rubripirellula lacrimiformis]QDT02623.1 hypothetical protein K227x_10010 [Rubripirellula lacrimiformis]
MNRLHRTDIRLKIAGRIAPVMFGLSLSFLVAQAILVVVWVDIPNLSENALTSLDPSNPETTRLRSMITNEVVSHRIIELAGLIMAISWPVVIAESVWHWTTRPWTSSTWKSQAFALLICLCPSLRIGARSPEMNGRLWLPGLGWRQTNRRLRERLERTFSIPMIAIAMLILPVLVIEFFLKAQVAQHTWLRLILHVGTGVIWFAFALEFILMLSVADKKLAYCKKHWIDLAIISLPVFSFMRTLQWMRATKLLKLQQLTQLARVYRLRGTAVKALRALTLLDMFQRFLHRDPDRSIQKLQRRLSDVQSEARQIQRKIKRLQKRSEATLSALADDNEEIV